MTQPIKNEWTDKVIALQAENDELRVDRLAWAAYGFMGGLFAAALMYAWARG